MQWVQILILGLMLGGVYAVMASGLTLIFGVMRIVNLAHATFILLAAYLTFYLFEFFGLDPILSILVTIPVLFVVGMAVYLLLFPDREQSTVRRVHGPAHVRTRAAARGHDGPDLHGDLPPRAPLLRDAVLPHR